ncbi:MAG: threonine synthase [Lachnospiraceae bacterium]|nr:threonine synthase [Lachnospiraceae bacterium]
MPVFYQSTRGGQKQIPSAQAILQGLSPDGGLYVPDHIPALPVSLEELATLSYQETAFQVMKEFLTDFTEDELRYCITHAYDSKFDTEEIVRMKQADGKWYLELFHGKTIAFKDMALSILPYLMTTAAKKCHVTNEIVILTATSGDTGKAALAGFADVPGTKIIVFYPKDGVSYVQEKQMVTQQGDNTCVIGIRGNFDDAQNGVKRIFSDVDMKQDLAEKGYQFSSANSINIGRLVPQIVYYVHSYGLLLKEGALRAGEKMDITVPTGNFGNILAAWYARRMGLPTRRLICASNENRVLTDFFTDGVYDKNRPFILTSSPSMDILISSNLERLIYEIAGEDPAECAALMKQLGETGRYEITLAMRERLQGFTAGCASEEQTAGQIKKIWEKCAYVLDPHTAVASFVCEQIEGDDPTPVVIASTASPFKFTGSVMRAIEGEAPDDEFALVDKLSRMSDVRVPAAVDEIRTAPVLHKTVVDKDGMKQAVYDALHI